MQHSTQSDKPPPKYVRRIEQDEMWDEVQQISSQEYPSNLSDEVTKIRCEMKYPERLVRYTPPVLTLISLDWQFHIATDI